MIYRVPLLALKMGLEQAGGQVAVRKVEDRARFLAAIRQASETTEDPRGPIRLDEYNSPAQNVYILKVEKAGGRRRSS